MYLLPNTLPEHQKEFHIQLNWINWNTIKYIGNQTSKWFVYLFFLITRTPQASNQPVQNRLSLPVT